MAHRDTPEQAEIADHAAGMREGDHMKVLAFAGAGKTTTLKKVASVIPRRGCYLAFNKSIADEAKRKLAATRCSASTMHALAYGAMREVVGSPASLNARSFRESGISQRFRIPRLAGWNEYRVASAVVRTLATFCASDDEQFDARHGRDALIASVGDPEMIRDRTRKEEAAAAIDALAPLLATMARDWWIQLVEEGRYSHDMYLKAIDLDDALRRDTFRGYKYLMVDEAQDLNPVQRSILLKTGLTIIAVGDPYQQIYSWRGAENALALLPGETKYLTSSFRFGEELAARARMILASRPDGGPEQRLIGAGPGAGPHAGPAAAIICRTNLGMIDEALNMAKKGIAFHVDNLEGLLGDVRSALALFQGRTRDVTSAELRHFETWGELQAEAEEGDQALGRLVSLVEQNRVPQIERLGQVQVADPDTARALICTAHRSKGLEFPAVKLAGDWKDIGTMEGRWKKSRKMSGKHEILAMEEWNALYVGATRAITRLAGLERIYARDEDLEPASQEP
ncbi:UvrD-helicase domain-containing protein [Cereibacter sphaeroides]|uniref:UvrD-helicase domain-containing protein n=1 Tax=Cereibacter sphaeroides TaxID=1063 RepID=UPI001F1D55DB|nr:UvrD-helicase domain-containing protein [Cereibacter sphaeroides]MCE6959645.1 UvrD-helicase domain-containing protein [Cereibacter sphaeroides]MCE6974494.1 UvrD-helicase domain-containing protein [Cereibacter sphaeroides]